MTIYINDDGTVKVTVPEITDNDHPITLQMGDLPPEPLREDDIPIGFHRHPNGGGLVADTAYVSGTAYVSSNARVSGTACVSGNARVSGTACVSGNAYVSDGFIS